MKVLCHDACQCFGMLWVIRDRWLSHEVTCVGIGCWVLRGGKRRRGWQERKKTCWRRLSDSQQISTIYRIATSNPKLSQPGPVGQDIYTDSAGLCLLVCDWHGGNSSAADADEINPFSLIAITCSPLHTGGRAGWLLYLANRRESFSPLHHHNPIFLPPSL